MTQAITTVNGAYSIATTDYTVVCNNPGTTKTLTLPSAAGNTGKVFIIKRIGAGGCSVSGVAAVDGGSSIFLSAPGTAGGSSAIMVQSDGTNWYIMAQAF